MAINYEALANFRYEIRRFLNFSESAAHAAGIEPQQHQALLAIKGLCPGETATVGMLADRLQIQHHSAVELSHRLESKGLVSRSRAQRDRRQVLLALTPRGEKLLRELSSVHHGELSVAGPRLINALRNAVNTPSREMKTGPKGCKASSVLSRAPRRIARRRSSK